MAMEGQMNDLAPRFNTEGHADPGSLEPSPSHVLDLFPNMKMCLAIPPTKVGRGLAYIA